MIKKGKKVVLVTTMLSVLTANIPSVAVYADDNMSSIEPSALDLNEAVFASLSGSTALAAHTDDGMDNWLNTDNLNEPKESDDLEDSGEDGAPGTGDTGQDHSPTAEDQDMDNSLISGVPSEDSGSLPEGSGSNDNLDSEHQNGSDSLTSENESENSLTNTQVPNATPDFNMGGESYGTTGLDADIPQEGDCLKEDCPVIENLTSMNPGDASLDTDMLNVNNTSTQNGTTPDVITTDDFTYDTKTGVLTIKNNKTVDYFNSSYWKDVLGYEIPNFNVESVKEVVIEDTVTEIGYSAFSDCSGLKKVTFSKGLTSIGESAFSGCTDLSNIILPDKLKTIKKSAFERCSALRSIIIPAEVTSIGHWAFTSGKDGYSHINDVTFKGSVAPEKMWEPFGHPMDWKSLSVYIPYGSINYDSQINGSYTLWFLPELQPKISGDTAYFQISHFNSYKDFNFYQETRDTQDGSLLAKTPTSSLPDRNVSYSYTLQKKDAAGNWVQVVQASLSKEIKGRWEDEWVIGVDGSGNETSYKFEVPSFIEDEHGQDTLYTIDPAKLTCNLGAASLADGIYRCVVNAAWHYSIGLEANYELASYEFEWNRSIAQPFDPGSSNDGSDSDQKDDGSDTDKKDNGFDYGHKDDDSDSDQKDDGPNSDSEDDDTNADKNVGGSDSDQNSGNTIGSISTGSSQMQGGQNNSSSFGQGTIDSAVSSGSGSRDDSNTSESILAGSQENAKEDINSKDQAEKTEDSDTVEIVAKDIGLFNGHTNIILVSFISILFIARIMMLLIKKIKTDIL